MGLIINPFIDYGSLNKPPLAPLGVLFSVKNIPSCRIKTLIKLGKYCIIYKKERGYIMEKNIITEVYGTFEYKTDSKKWGDNITLIFDNKDQFDYVKKCLSFFENMPDEMESRLSKYLLRYYKEYTQDCGIEMEDEIDEENILKNIHIISIIADKKCREDVIEFQVEGTCDWEPEHELEITISDGKILYVGAFEDYAPNSKRLEYALETYGYYDPDETSNMNYADKE